MELLGRCKLNAFAAAVPRCQEPFNVFAHEVEEASWKNFREIKDRYRFAQVGTNSQVVFGFVENHYLVETLIRLDKGLLVVQRVWASTARPIRKSALN